MIQPAIRALMDKLATLRACADGMEQPTGSYAKGVRWACNEIEEALLAAGEAAETPQPPQTSERVDDIPLDVRRELMDCAVQNGRISFYWLCHLYRRGRDAATTYSPGVPTAETPQLAVGVHRCKICGTRWLLWPDTVHGGGWNLLDNEQRPGGCCDNVAMGDQIEHLRDIPLTLAASLSPVKDDALSTAIAFCMFVQGRADVPEAVKGTAGDVEEELRAASLSPAVPPTGKP